MKTKILVVDDDPGIVRLISTALEGNGYEVDTALDGASALEMAAKKENYALIVADIVMPEMSGFDFLKSLIKAKPDTPIIIVSGHANFTFAQEALHIGAVAFLLKPFEKKELLKWVDRVMAHEKERTARSMLFARLISEKHETVLDTATIMEKDNFSLLVGDMAERFITRGCPGKILGIKIVLAIHEALRNSVEHGNLELFSDLKSGQDIAYDEDMYEKLMKERLDDPKYAGRKIWFTFSRTDKKVELKIRDEGKGFDHKSTFKAQTDTELSHGRGILMINAGVDEVSFNDSGTEVTLTCFPS